jgi:hypothetical protein
MALNPCVQQILCPLSDAVKNAFAGVIGTTIATLQAQVATITATLILIQPQKAIAIAARDAVLLVFEAVTVPLQLVPLSLIAGCKDLGFTMASLNAGFDDVRAEVARVVDEANRQITYDAFLTQKRDVLNAAIAQLEAVQIALAECP